MQNAGKGHSVTCVLHVALFMHKNKNVRRKKTMLLDSMLGLRTDFEPKES